ncbi:methylated-DNA--[protein]-cysteine S-methyltransferase [Marinomonas mediterranea]|jgi:O-6-methylguanine DNA methyltransferase|uniref:Methylated-DNA--protein-cysteine methyltransferase n=1 Tax=Marinomonas mediterranea (strain ATCC 700492 / JCM 21426 / NBRC 103028 / MMB-1) TaxID=717774 RepID=F2JZY7_MARM1|nr:methylated-DNA--[protein]-cysteine S-methyltransferase [Marinomonas mediterranea]ADZ92099.1 methylated-DNA/protein-cysteine methyltransferase [Marinomonas mediterranea MMB-1]WCN10060.1 methylated-DNA--[protein]-cysteine S-methyltransferase [Marinomonas mediterranea]WCN14111.1 methylated-DNA--[protein]-cysteine S-methyltransferase [Marinomonas mediterranea]WCN18166.1 methylated-DNA--[protein]-cysteine S-methyltransferase [Marinomonas mediterranea MMB-1]
MTYNDYFESPLGKIEIKASDKGITQVIFCGEQTTEVIPSPIIDECKSQLHAYFSGQLNDFQLPLDMQGTEFQNRVWRVLTTIPFGKTMSYLDIAEKLNNPKAVRAVGGANGRNPISLIVPCHRVIGSKGTLTGYAGGVARKQWLLEHEGIALKGNSDNLEALNDAIHRRQDKTQFLD